ncbi:unnamed protein product, partial [Polarella glacialis]
MLRAGAQDKGQGHGSFPERNQGNDRAMWLVVDRYLSDVLGGSWRSDSREALYEMFYDRFLRNVETSKRVLAFIRQHRYDSEVKDHKMATTTKELLDWAREILAADHDRKEWLFSKLLSKLGGQWTRYWSTLGESIQDELRLLLGAESGLSKKQQAKIDSVMGTHAGLG